jgi:hypothetical protein
MRAHKLDQDSAERKRDMGDQPIFIAAEVKDYAVVRREIDGAAELPFYLRRIVPTRFGRNREPRTDWPFGRRVALPKFLQRPMGNDLHGEALSPIAEFLGQLQ